MFKILKGTFHPLEVSHILLCNNLELKWAFNKDYAQGLC